MSLQPPPESPIAWLDLETTGSDTDTVDILELAIVLTDDNMVPLVAEDGGDASYQATYKPTMIDLWSLDPVVIEMHSESGLWRDILNDDPLDPWTNYEMLDLDINAWLNRYWPRSKHIRLAGSGVSHFDRQILKRLLPKTSKRFTYWAYDDGAIRRFMRDHVRWENPITSDIQPNHRALQDVYAAIAEYTMFRKTIRMALAQSDIEYIKRGLKP